jgi:hypothetical protein
MSELEKSRDHAHIMGLLLRYAQIGGADMRAMSVAEFVTTIPSRLLPAVLILSNDRRMQVLSRACAVRLEKMYSTNSNTSLRQLLGLK